MVTSPLFLRKMSLINEVEPVACACLGNETAKVIVSAAPELLLEGFGFEWWDVKRCDIAEINHGSRKR
jgi:hypothetical protein